MIRNLIPTLLRDRHVSLGFRPVLEVLNPDTLGSNGLKVVTLALGGGKLGNSSKDIQIIVKNGSAFAAPASEGLTRPDGDTGSYFMWLGSDGKLYAPGDSVPADVTKLTAQFALSEQFSLTPGGRYYFDLSAMNIPGTANRDLLDSTLHYVPFTYAGTVDAYKLMSEMATTEEYAQRERYPHSLFVADYAVTHTVSWDDLNTAGLIFGKNYAAGGVDYTLRAPSAGSGGTGSGEPQHGTPQSNEWDTMLNKNSGYIQNWKRMLSWGQDTTSYLASTRAGRGYHWVRFWGCSSYSDRNVTLGFRPVLEVLKPDTLGSDRLKAVTRALGGGKLGNSSEDIQIIVKNGGAFTAPASEGLTRPDGNTGSYFMWLGSDGKLYAPRGSVPADVTKLTAQFAGSSGGGSGGGSRSGGKTSYSISGPSGSEIGSVSISPQNAAEGKRVTITVVPKEGYALESLAILDQNGKEIASEDKGNGEFTFIMPASKVKIKAVFEPISPEQEGRQTVVQMQIGSKLLISNGVASQKDAAPVIRNNRTLVPIRFITEALGGEVKWNETAKEVILVMDGKEIRMTIGKALEKYGVAPIIIDGRTYVPVRFVADELKAMVAWDNETKTVTITRNLNEK